MEYKFNFQDHLSLDVTEKHTLRHIFWYRVKRTLKKILKMTLVIIGMLLMLGCFIIYHQYFTS